MYSAFSEIAQKVVETDNNKSADEYGMIIGALFRYEGLDVKDVRGCDLVLHFHSFEYHEDIALCHLLSSLDSYIKYCSRHRSLDACAAPGV